MTDKNFETVTPYESPSCGILFIQPEQIFCGSNVIDDFDRIEDDWI